MSGALCDLDPFAVPALVTVCLIGGVVVLRWVRNVRQARRLASVHVPPPAPSMAQLLTAVVLKSGGELSLSVAEVDAAGGHSLTLHVADGALHLSALVLHLSALEGS